MIFLAFKYLMEKKKQTFFTLLGVFFGALAYVAVSGFFVGFQGYLIEQLVNTSAHVHIQARLDTLTPHMLDTDFFGPGITHVFWGAPPSGVLGYQEVQNPQEWYSRLNADPRVESYSPLITVGALLTLSKVSLATTILGCLPEEQAKVTNVSDYITDGSFSDIAGGGNRLILGAEIMRRLGAAVGKYVMVSVGTFAPIPFLVVGRYETGNRGSDMQAYGALTDLQLVNHTPNRVTEIGVRLKDYSQAGEIAASWQKIAPELTESWDQQAGNILGIFKIQDALRFSMIITVLVVAGFGIYNVLNMTVNQKRQDIAILRSMGYDTFDVVMLFFSQGLIVGVVGSILGMVSGYFLCLYLQTIPFSGGPIGGKAGFLHIAIHPAIYFQAIFLALVSSSLASVLPARAAGKLTPIEIIRSGG